MSDLTIPMTAEPQATTAATVKDPLLVCMAMTTELLGKPVHLQVLRSGLALDDDGHVPHASYPSMVHEYGLVAAWSRTPVTKIPTYVLPVLVPLHDGRACVLKSAQGDEATVLWPETGMAPQTLSLQELESLAQETVLLVKAPAQRSEQTLAPLHGAAFAWFWGTLWRFRHYYVESMVATVVANILTLASVFFTMNVYDRVVPTQAYASLWTLAIGTLIAALLEFVMRWLKAHNAEGYLQRRWEMSNAAGSDAYKKIRSLTNLIMGLSSTVQQLVTVAMVVAGVYLIHANQLTQGGLIASVILAGRALAPLASVMSLAARFQQALSSLETLDGLIQRPRDRVHGRTYVVPAAVHGHLEAQALEFAYPGEHKIPVIKKLSMQIPAGHKVAMLGRVGSGKSTLLRLMSGLYAPLGGSVRLDGVELQQLEPSEVRARIGYVGQDAQLFMGTLRENLVLSDSWISDARILEVLRTLGLYEMVAAHPRGLDMPITEAGGGLSGGQRQLLAIARMMLRDPQLVFMDEPTANMDQNTEARIIAALKPWLQGRTLLMSTHRPQLLEWADAIAVIEGGQCLAFGPKQDMIDKLSRGIDVPAPRAAA